MLEEFIMMMRKIPRRTDENYITPWMKYKNTVNSLTKPAGSFKIGNVYSLGYNFSKEYDYDKLMWFDYMPLVYIVDMNHEKGYFTGINLHHFPVTFREQWFKTIITGKRFGVPKFAEQIMPFLQASVPKQFKRKDRGRLSGCPALSEVAFTLGPSELSSIT